MLFLLNHSTGALVLNADDRNQVLSWTRRQLGANANLASILELDAQLVGDWVEKSGTGIMRSSPRACEPKLSFMADSIQGLEGVGSKCVDSKDWYQKSAIRSRTAAVH